MRSIRETSSQLRNRLWRADGAKALAGYERADRTFSDARPTSVTLAQPLNIADNFKISGGISPPTFRSRQKFDDPGIGGFSVVSELALRVAVTGRDCVALCLHNSCNLSIIRRGIVKHRVFYNLIHRIKASELMNSIYDTPPAEPSLFLTLVEAARLLVVSPQTLNRWSKKGVIPRFKGKRMIRYRRSDIEAFARQQMEQNETPQEKQPAAEEEEAERRKIHEEHTKLLAVDVSKLTAEELARHEAELRRSTYMVTVIRRAEERDHDK
jgi:Helix-turn-helix domain